MIMNALNLLWELMTFYIEVTNAYGRDSQAIASYFKAFASYIEVPKKKWNKYHAPYKDVVNHVPVRNTEVCTVFLSK